MRVFVGAALIFLLAGIASAEDASDEAKRICASDAYRAVCGQWYDPRTDSKSEQERRKQQIEQIRKHEQEWLDNSQQPAPPEYPTGGPS